MCSGLEFAKSIGVLSEVQAQDHYATGWQAIIEVARAHGQSIEADHPSQRFLNTLADAIHMGAAYLADRQSGEPKAGMAARGVKIGWFDDQIIYLLPQVSFRLVEDHLRQRGGLGIGPNLLHRELAEHL